MSSKYSFKSLLKSIIYFEKKLYQNTYYDKDSLAYLLQSLFIHYLNESDIDYFQDYDSFLFKITTSIPFQKQLYFNINYIENINKSKFELNYYDLNSIYHPKWFLE